MTLDIGFNFRNSTWTVTDVSPDLPVLTPGGNHLLYPTAYGVTNAGWNANPGPQARDRNASNNAKLAGMHFAQAGEVWKFRVDLLAAGAHDIRLAFGEPNYAQSDMWWRILDNTTQLASVHTSTSSANNFRDATNTQYTAANWVTSNTAVRYTFSTTTFFLEIGNVSSTSASPVAHLRITEVGGGGPSAIAGSGALVFSSTIPLIAQGILEPLSTAMAIAGSAVITATSRLAGSADLAFSADVGTANSNIRTRLRSFTNLSGTNWLEVLNKPYLSSATINAIAGSAALQVDGAGVPRGTGVVVGSGALLFGGSNVLKGFGTLSGTSPILLGGVLTVPGFNPITGTAALSFDAIVHTETIAPIIGVGELVFQQGVTPTLSTCSRPGSAAIALGATGDILPITERGIGRRHDVWKQYHVHAESWLQTLSPWRKSTGAVTADAALALGATATATAISRAAGLADLALVGNALASSGGNLSGTTALTFGATAPGPGVARGSADLTFDAVARAAGATAGSADIIIAAPSTLRGTGNLQATSLLSLGMIGEVHSSTITGSASITFLAEMGERYRAIGAVLRRGMNFNLQSAFHYVQPNNTNATKLIAVSTSLVLTATGTMVAAGNMTGVAALTFGGTALARGAAAGSSNLEFIALGLPMAVGVLEGFCNLSFVNSGGLAPAQIVTAIANLRFFALGRHSRPGWGHVDGKPPNWTPKPPKGPNWTPRPPVGNGWIKKTGT